MVRHQHPHHSFWSPLFTLEFHCRNQIGQNQIRCLPVCKATQESECLTSERSGCSYTSSVCFTLYPIVNGPKHNGLPWQDFFFNLSVSVAEELTTRPGPLLGCSRLRTAVMDMPARNCLGLSLKTSGLGLEIPRTVTGLQRQEFRQKTSQLVVLW